MTVFTHHYVDPIFGSITTYPNLSLELATFTLSSLLYLFLLFTIHIPRPSYSKHYLTTRHDKLHNAQRTTKCLFDGLVRMSLFPAPLAPVPSTTR